MNIKEHLRTRGALGELNGRAQPVSVDGQILACLGRALVGEGVSVLKAVWLLFLGNKSQRGLRTRGIARAWCLPHRCRCGDTINILDQHFKGASGSILCMKDHHVAIFGRSREGNTHPHERLVFP